MHMELTGPRIHMSRQIAKGTANGPSLPQPLQAGPVAQQTVAWTHLEKQHSVQQANAAAAHGWHVCKYVV